MSRNLKPALAGRPFDHDPLVCGLGDKYCPGCATEPPDPEGPPWGNSLLDEYRRLWEQWGELHGQDRPGASRAQRDQLAIEKAKLFDRAAAVRARCVNEVVTLIRWAWTDNPGALATVLREVIFATVEPDLTALAHEVIRVRRGPR